MVKKQREHQLALSLFLDMSEGIISSLPLRLSLLELS